MGRNLLTILLTIFVPTVLLNMISYSTNFFKPFFFEASVTVNLTAMLVLTTLFKEKLFNIVALVNLWMVLTTVGPFLFVWSSRLSICGLGQSVEG